MGPLQLFLLLLQNVVLASVILTKDILETQFLPALDYSDVYNLALTCCGYWNSVAGEEVRRLREIGVHCTEPVACHVLEVLRIPSKRRAMAQFCKDQLAKSMEKYKDFPVAVENFQIALSILEASKLISDLWHCRNSLSKVGIVSKILELARVPPESMKANFLRNLVFPGVFRSKRIDMGSFLIRDLDDLAQIFVIDYSRRFGIDMDFALYEVSSQQSEVLFWYLKKLLEYKKAQRIKVNDIAWALKKQFSDAAVLKMIEEAEYDDTSNESIRSLLRQEMSNRVWKALYDLLGARNDKEGDDRL